MAQNKLDEHMVATPVLLDNRLYLRSDTHLYCIGKKVADSGETH